MQGWRKTMEDSHLCVTLKDGLSLFGVFDGHGGKNIKLKIYPIMYRSRSRTFREKELRPCLVITLIVQSEKLQVGARRVVYEDR